jgi:hypothetical protein
MPASRILEGSLSEQPRARTYFLAANHSPQTEPKRDIKGKALG